MDTPRKIEQYTDAELMAKFWDYFGGRGVAIFGWCMVGALSGTSDAAELRRRLEAKGLSKTALYDALAELRDFHESLEGVPLPRRDSSFAIKLANRVASAGIL